MHEVQEAPVEFPLHLAQRQVIVVLTERLVDLQGNVDQAPEREGHEEAHGDGGNPRLDDLARPQRGHGPVYDQHDRDHLGVGEGERYVLDLACVVQVHDSSRELLEGSRQQRRGNLECVRRLVIHNQPLDPLQQDLTPVGAVHHELQALLVHTGIVDDLQRIVVEVADLLQGRTVEHARQADEGVLEGLHLFLELLCLVAEGKESAHGVEPFTADLVDQRSAFPKSRVRLIVAEHNKETQDRGVAGPELLHSRHAQWVSVDLVLPHVHVQQQREDCVRNGPYQCLREY
mmetsp:Transcript_13861/g.41372  ORF Transcript_13861/g.41372 Transcript_13861/m.41372 type:complete len:288 (+) Transcript_13861:754-1617(+)